VNNLLIPLNHPSTYCRQPGPSRSRCSFYVVSPFVLAVFASAWPEGGVAGFRGCAVTMMVAIAVLALILPLQWLYFPGLGGYAACSPAQRWHSGQCGSGRSSALERSLCF